MKKIPRLIPLWWICIGNPNKTTTAWHQSQTYFSSKNVEFVKIGENIKKFWDVEYISVKLGKKMMSPEDKVTPKMVDKSIKHDGQQYEVAIQWKRHPGTCLLNNYSDAEQRLYHIKNQLSKKPEVFKAYQETINKYLTKGYIRQVDTTAEGNFFAHYQVVRAYKYITKIRIVFDASASRWDISKWFDMCRERAPDWSV